MTETHTGDAGADVTTILADDHNEMLALLSQIEKARAPERRDFTDILTAEFMRHSVAEERHVYPEIEEFLPGGAEEVERAKEEHAGIVRLLNDMEYVDVGERRFMELLRELDSQLRQHVEREETEQFPKLRSQFSQEKLVDLGSKVQSAKKQAPTRPHRGGPHSELYHKTVGTGVGMVDRFRDAMTRRRT